MSYWIGLVFFFSRNGLPVFVFDLCHICLLSASWVLVLKRKQSIAFCEFTLNVVSICTVAVCYTSKYYMHGSLFFLKKVCRARCFGMLYARHSPKILLFSKNTAVCYILECYMHGSSIQFVVFKPLSYCFEETVGFDK